MQEGEFGDVNPNLLGDVVISIDTAVSEAQTLGIPTEMRVIQLLVHGILHLLGYDHEKTEKEARRMEQKSNEVLEQIKNSGT